MKNFRDLMVWRKAHSLTLKCYQTTNGFPNTNSMASPAGCVVVLRQLQPILPKAVASEVTLNSSAFSGSPLARRANWNTIFSYRATWG